MRNLKVNDVILILKDENWRIKRCDKEKDNYADYFAKKKIKELSKRTLD